METKRTAMQLALHGSAVEREWQHDEEEHESAMRGKNGIAMKEE